MKKILAVLLASALGNSAALAQQAVSTPNGTLTPAYGAFPSNVSATNSLALTTTASPLIIPIVNGQASLGFSTSGITGSGASVIVQGLAAGGSTYSTLTIFPIQGGVVPVTSSFGTDRVNYFVNTAGLSNVEFLVTGTGTGTATITTTASQAPYAGVPLQNTAATAQFVQITPQLSIPTHVSNTTSATAGVSSTVVAATGVTKGIVLQNTCGTAEWFSSSVTAGTALTALNSMTLAPGASFVSPDWYPVAGAWTIASATAVACTFVADYK